MYLKKRDIVNVLIFVQFLSVCLFSNPTVQINEVMAVNNSTIADETGSYSDWIELCNVSDDTININGWFLSDNPKKPEKFRLFSQNTSDFILPPQTCILLWTDKKPSAGPYHVNFKLDSQGEFLLLSDTSGTFIIDSLRFDTQYGDISFGRHPENSNNLVFFTQPTPGLQNSFNLMHILKPPAFSKPGGYFSHPQTVTIATSNPRHVVACTFDGSDPVLSDSATYKKTIHLTKTSILRARTFSTTDSAESPIVTHSFIIGENFTLPVVSLVTDPHNLWDEDSGIYVKGKNAQDAYPYFGANFNQNWERTANFEYFNPSKSVYLNNRIIFRISGKYSRGMAKKSFMLETDNTNGNTYFSHQFFPEKQISQFQKMILRADAAGGYHFKNELIYKLNIEAGSSVSVQAYHPVNVFLNGEYWGIYNIMESKGMEFIKSNFSVEDAHIIQKNGEVVSGSYAEFSNLISFINSLHHSDSSSFRLIDSAIDIRSFIDYWFYELYTGKHDNGNIRFWKSSLPGSKWRWISYDMDSWTLNRNNFKYLTTDSVALGYSMIGPLLSNPQFRTKFINRCADLLNTVFSADNVKKNLSDIQSIITHDLIFEQERWEYLQNWNRLVNEYNDFADKRPAILRQQLIGRFNLDSTLTLSHSASSRPYGTISINSINFNLLSNWKGTYFSGVPVTISTQIKNGYFFHGWKKEDLPQKLSFTHTFSQDACISPIITREGELPENEEVYPDLSPFLKSFVSENGMVQLSFPNAQATLIIYNLSGQQINSYKFNKKFTSNNRLFTWNCQNRRGMPVTAGLYIFNLTMRDAAGFKQHTISKTLMIDNVR